MCVMSCEIWLQLRWKKYIYFHFIFKYICTCFLTYRGDAANEKRYRTEILVGYFFPLIISLMTGIVESFASKDSIIKPGFGDKNCSFASKYYLYRYLVLEKQYKKWIWTSFLIFWKDISFQFLSFLFSCYLNCVK